MAIDQLHIVFVLCCVHAIGQILHFCSELSVLKNCRGILLFNSPRYMQSDIFTSFSTLIYSLISSSNIYRKD